MSSSDEKSSLLMNEKNKINFEKKLRFRQPSISKMLNVNNDRVEDLFKSERPTSDLQGDVNKTVPGRYPSLFSFIKLELTRGYVLEHDEERYSARREKVYSFMKIPREVEKFMSYGFLQCTESFLFVYTFLPVRVLLALWSLITRPIASCFGIKKKNYNSILSPAEVCDLLKATILVACSTFLFYIDINMLYHLIKSQSVIKLYIFYNMLEVADRLFSAFGQDTIDALFWTATEPRNKKREHFGVLAHLIFAVIYVSLHSLLVLFQATTLNVAINANNKALLTIMMSNNFVELKGSVFKKFDKNNLFQVSCSDVRERFHLFVLLFIVVLQTMKEYSWRADRFWVLIPDCVIVLFAEILVDWLKHAFITRFNELHLDVYRDYTTSLAYDMTQTRQKHAFSDHSDLVARRMGFIPLPLGVVMIRVLANAIYLTDTISIIIALLAYLCLASYKILNSIFILGKACDLIAQHKCERASSNQSPSSTNINSNIPAAHSNGKNVITKDWLKDTATSPLKPSAEPVIIRPVVSVNGINSSENNKTSSNNSSSSNNNNNNDDDDGNIVNEQPKDLSSAAIFSNSTVYLNNVTLNEELLKVDGEDIKIEPATIEENVTRSEPNINCDYNIDENTENVVTECAESSSMKKRAESEPNLANCTETDDIVI